MTELLGLPQAPELLRRQDGPPHGSHAALLQVRGCCTAHGSSSGAAAAQHQFELSIRTKPNCLLRRHAAIQPVPSSIPPHRACHTPSPVTPQLPAVATSSLGLLAADDANARPPSAHLHHSAPASTPGGGGGSAGCSWQRRAVLLLSPALVEAAEAAAEARAGGGLEELQAVVAAALGPMLMPGRNSAGELAGVVTFRWIEVRLPFF